MPPSSLTRVLEPRPCPPAAGDPVFCKLAGPCSAPRCRASSSSRLSSAPSPRRRVQPGCSPRSPKARRPPSFAHGAAAPGRPGPPTLASATSPLQQRTSVAMSSSTSSRNLSMKYSTIEHPPPCLLAQIEDLHRVSTKHNQRGTSVEVGLSTPNNLLSSASCASSTSPRPPVPCFSSSTPTSISVAPHVDPNLLLPCHLL